APGFDALDPLLRRALTLAHASLGRLLRRRLVGEDVDPDLAAALDLAGHRDTGSFDLAVGDPTDLERLHPEVAELHLGLALRLAAHAPTLELAVLGLLGQEHQLSAFFGRDGFFSAAGSPDCSSF